MFKLSDQRTFSSLSVPPVRIHVRILTQAGMVVLLKGIDNVVVVEIVVVLYQRVQWLSVVLLWIAMALPLLGQN